MHRPDKCIFSFASVPPSGLAEPLIKFKIAK